MKTTQQVIDAIVGQGMLPLYFHPNEEKSSAILRALYRSGVRAIEYTNRGASAHSNFKKLIEIRNTEMQDLTLGIGTIKNLQQAKDYLAVGADFLVSPGYDAEVAAYCVERDLFFGPGCMSPTEIMAAENTGVKFVKLFPGNLLGPEYMSSIRDIFPNMIFMPTGGVDTTQESISAWYNSGVKAVGMGSKLVSKALMEAGDYEGIEAICRKVLDIIAAIRNK
ncbi:MAG: bifunctional 4-hydroxy-2-oxoglutarate aldolase/2-dehydro-3-deoxy-phosphogluconate aldolase [Chitinophagaceae bacterium]|jgi:2-dehydro-3-deoxyphosphogluconate aldolase/(4S)-4-hydroxy-2-oxoglutarate aldolase